MAIDQWVIVTADGHRTPVTAVDRPGWRDGDPLEFVDDAGAAWGLTFDGQITHGGVVVEDAGIFTAREVAAFDRAEGRRKASARKGHTD